MDSYLQFHEFNNFSYWQIALPWLFILHQSKKVVNQLLNDKKVTAPISVVKLL